MFGLGTGEILTILIVSTLMFGAKRLPELGRNLGHGMRGFRDALRGVDENDQGVQPAESFERAPAPKAPRKGDDNNKQSLGQH